VKSSRLFTIFLIVFIDLLGFSIILPLLPYYAETYGATPFIVGLLVASYAAAQLLGAPLLGRLSDRIGRRPVLLMSVAGTFIGFLLLGLADPLGNYLAGLINPAAANTIILGILFFSRILDGLTGGNITVAQAYITDVTDDQNRAKGLGMIGAAFGLGFIIGPVVGGSLSQYGYSLPAFVAAAISFLNLVMIFFLLPESLTPERRIAESTQKRPPFTFKALQQALTRPKVGPLLQLRFFFSLGFATFQTVFTLFAQGLGLSAQTTSYLLAFVGLMAAIVQGGMIGRLTKRFKENWLIITGLWIMTGALLAWAFTSQLYGLVIVIIPLAVAGGVLNTVIQSALTKSVTRQEVGGLLGIATSVESLTRVIAPLAGSYLLQSLGLWAPGVFSALLMGWAIVLAYWRIVRPANRPPVEAGTPVVE
jgi:DHA1 family tetracycline resistance protein-like MFS transporter